MTLPSKTVIQFYKAVFSQIKTNDSFNVHVCKILPHIFKYIIFCADHFVYVARMVLYNQYVEVTSSNSPQNADVYSRVSWCLCG